MPDNKTKYLAVRTDPTLLARIDRLSVHLSDISHGGVLARRSIAVLAAVVRRLEAYEAEMSAIPKTLTATKTAKPAKKSRRGS